jgi:hypothetical protein
MTEQAAGAGKIKAAVFSAWHLSIPSTVNLRGPLFHSCRVTDRFLEGSEVQLALTKFQVRRAAFSSQFKSKVGNILAKAASPFCLLWIIKTRVKDEMYECRWTTLRIKKKYRQSTYITSRLHTHPSHTQNSHLLTSSLSLGVPVPLF